MRMLNNSVINCMEDKMVPDVLVVDKVSDAMLTVHRYDSVLALRTASEITAVVCSL